MSPKNQNVLDRVYAFYALQDEILKANNRSSKVQKEMRGKITAWMRMVPELERARAHLYMGVQPAEIVCGVVEHWGMAA